MLTHTAWRCALALLPLLTLPMHADAANAPGPAQIEAAVMAVVEKETPAEPTDQQRVLQAMFTPRGFEHGPCFASATVTGAYECLVGLEIGVKTRYRMLRFLPQGTGWTLQQADVDAPVPPRERVRALAVEQMQAEIATSADAAHGEALRTFQLRFQVLAIEDCELRESRAAEISCEVTLGDDQDRGTRIQTYVFDAQGQWQNAVPATDDDER